MKQALEDIVKLLEMNKVETSFTDVADLLWLYSAMGGDVQSSEAVNNKETKEEKQESQRQDTLDNHNKEQEESSEDTEADNRSSLHTNSDKEDGKSKGDYFRTPTRKQFNQFNQFATVFKILKQFSNSSSEQEFNENETIDYIANTNVWNIQTTQKKELKYTLFIVIEKSNSMRIWEEITQEFVSALSRFSFFKDVQVVYLKELDEKYQLYRDKQCNKKVSIKLFNSQTQRTLTILLSDCISKGWQDKRGYGFLDKVTAVTPFLIINMLPQRVWNRTMVNDSWRVKFTHRDGWKNSSLVSDEEDDIKEELGSEEFIRVPMTTLEKIPLKHWSNVIAGYKNNWLHGSLFEAEVFNLDIPPKDEIRRTPLSSITPEQQVKNFYAYASPLAHELAVYFSAVPILSIEIMKMIQKTSLPKTNYTHLAEVFLSGLLKRGKFKTKANDDTYLFKDKIIKEVLSKRLPPQLKEKIRESNSEFIEEHLGHLQEFQSIVKSDEGFIDGISSDEGDGFASVAKKGSKLLKKKTIRKPAVFKTVTEKVLFSPARTEWKKITSDNPDFKEKTELIDIPAEYKMVTKKVMVTPEVEEEIEIHLDDTEAKIVNVVISELLSIGWNKKNILQDYKLSSNKRVDILLRHNEKNLTLIEVKAPRFDVKSVLDQAIIYGKELGVDYVYCTNGMEIYGYSIANEVGGIVTEYRSPNSMVVKWVKKVLLNELNQWKKSFEHISLLSENIEFAQSVNNSIVLINKLIEIVNISEYEDLEPLFDEIDKLEKSKQSKEDNEFSDNPFEILTHELKEINTFLYSLSSLVIYDESKEVINNLINNLNKIFDIINKADIYELEELLARKNVILNSIEKFGLKPIPLSNDNDATIEHASNLIENSIQTIEYINRYKELIIEEGVKNIINKGYVFDTYSLKQFKEAILKDFDWIVKYINNMNQNQNYPKNDNIEFYDSYCNFYTFLSDSLKSNFLLKELFLHLKDIYCEKEDIKPIALHQSKRKIFKERYEDDIVDYLMSYRPNEFEYKEIYADWLPSDNNEANIVAYDGAESVEIKKVYKVKNNSYQVNIEMQYEVEIELNIFKIDYYADEEEFSSYTFIGNLNDHYVTVARNVILNVEGKLYLELDDISEIIKSKFSLELGDVEIIEEKKSRSYKKETDLNNLLINDLDEKQKQLQWDFLLDNQEDESMKFDYIKKKLITIKSAVEIDSDLGLFDIHKLSEDIFMHILNDVYGWSLKNANLIQENFPAIDLVDDNNKIVIQVTSTTSTTKLRNTIEKFKELDNKYSSYKLKMFYINTKPNFQKTTLKEFEKEGVFKSDLLGIKDILELVKSDLDILERVYTTLKKIHIDAIFSEAKKVNKSEENPLINEVSHHVDVEDIKIIKNGEILGEIILKTVPIEIKEKILNVSIYPVTFEEYDLFCEDKGIDKPNAFNWGRKKRPVIDVSWYDAIEYCKWLGKKSNKNYRLLTSEEWLDIAKRDIPNKKFKKYIVHSKLKTEKVGTKKVGQLGLYDFVGNVYEWCDKRETEKVVRGLLFSDKLTSYQNLFNEILLQPTTSNFKIGFRIVKETF